MIKTLTESSQKRFLGVGISPGIAIGTAYTVELPAVAFYGIHIAAVEVLKELERLTKALDGARRQLEKIKEKFESEVGKEHSYIIDAHLLILEDRQFLESIEKMIRQDLYSPERAVKETAGDWLRIYRSLKDPFFQERVSDLEEVAGRIIANLTELNPQPGTDLPDDLILIASEMSLSVLVEYQLDHVKSLVLSKGGRTSHIAIIARSYQIPVVSSIEEIHERVHTGDTLIVDGTEGTVEVGPSPRDIRRYEVRRKKQKKHWETLAPDQSHCLTLDRRRIFIYSNTEVGSEVPLALRLGAEGIGLFRSEYIYMKSKDRPIGQEEQFAIYKNLAETVRERPTFIRTLDLGDGKHPYFAALAGENDTVLGLRGIRLSLAYPEIFRNQIRAILRASCYGNLKIVLPMVSSLDEVIESKQLVREEQKQLENEGIVFNRPIELGIMLEVPAALIVLEAILEEVDFLAVGTNDLIQYTLAAGRSNERMAYMFNTLHPAILNDLYRTSQLATAKHCTALVCGEIAAQSLYAYLLVGMGFQHLSMNLFAVPDMKKMIRRISFREARANVLDLLPLRSSREIKRFVEERLKDMENLGVPIGDG